MNSYDIDGVIYLGPKYEGLNPGSKDVIITGRSIDEYDETISMLQSRGIFNNVFFNPIPFNEKTRITSGIHKGNILKSLIAGGFDIKIHFEDDPIQAKEIEKICGNQIQIVMIVHELTNKENQRQESI